MCSSKKYPFSPPPTQGTFVLDPPPRHPPPQKKKKIYAGSSWGTGSLGKTYFRYVFFFFSLVVNSTLYLHMESQAASKGAKNSFKNYSWLLHFIFTLKSQTMAGSFYNF